MEYPFHVYGIIPGVLDREMQLSDNYLDSIVQLAKMAEKYKFCGALIHHNHHVINPWMLAAAIIQQTDKFIPLIALQPNSMSPYTAAKMVESFDVLYGRKVSLNLITGAVKEEFEQLGDYLCHDERYYRLGEYIQTMRSLLTSSDCVSYSGQYYQFNEATLVPGLLSQEKMPTFFVAGSSETGLKIALEQADVVVTHPEPINTFKEHLNVVIRDHRVNLGIRIGIITRPDKEEAWLIAKKRFPQTRIGNIKTTMKKKSESVWIRNLAELADQGDLFDEVFWIGAYRSSKSYCAYLVGSYGQVALYLSEYFNLGVNYLLLDGPFHEEEFIHINQILKKTMELSTFASKV